MTATLHATRDGMGRFTSSGGVGPFAVRIYAVITRLMCEKGIGVPDLAEGTGIGRRRMTHMFTDEPHVTLNIDELSAIAGFLGEDPVKIIKEAEGGDER